MMDFCVHQRRICLRIAIAHSKKKHRNDQDKTDIFLFDAFHDDVYPFFNQKIHTIPPEKLCGTYPYFIRKQNIIQHDILVF